MEKPEYNGTTNDVDGKPAYGHPSSDDDAGAHDIVVGEQNELHRNLKGRHMQMIAMSVSSPPRPSVHKRRQD